MIKTVAAIAGTVALGVGFTQVDVDMLRKSSAETSAYQSIRAVFMVASADAVLSGVPFDVALAEAVSAADDPHGTMSADGHSLVWKLGDDCFVSKFPDELTWVSPVSCPPPLGR